MGEDTWILPSAGPDYGKIIDQARLLKSRPFPTAMLLPNLSPHTGEGLAAGIRRFTDAMGKPAVLYIKSDYLRRQDTKVPHTLQGITGSHQLPFLP